MASKNSVKLYISDSFYHVYNRGVEKRNIFMNEQDYSVFLSYLQTYLVPKNKKQLRKMLTSEKSSYLEKDKALKLLNLKNYSASIDLVCYALLPNHFHLLIRQSAAVLNYFMNSLGTRYGMYFNRKYKRNGVLFQDVYKAVLVETEEQLLHLSRYIHNNPTDAIGLLPNQWAEAKFPSSLPEYLSRRHTNWIKTHYILDYFSKTKPTNTYEDFLEISTESILKNIAIDIES